MTTRTKASPHNRILAAAAREALEPLGLVRKGRSRTWLDDHGWWLGVVEFQPSGFGRGSYLNVGPTWLWAPEHDLYFSGPWEPREVWRDKGQMRQFIEYVDDEQFSRDAEELARRAARSVKRLRRRVPSLTGAASALDSGGADTWTRYDAAIAFGCAGEAARARELFDLVIAEEPEYEWEETRLASAIAYRSLLEDLTAFRKRVAAAIANFRHALQLEPREDPLACR